MQTADSRAATRQHSGLTSELAALRRELASFRASERPVDLRPMRRVTAARLLMSIPGFVELWKARVPHERVAGACSLSARPAGQRAVQAARRRQDAGARPEDVRAALDVAGRDTWAFECRCGREVVVPAGGVFRCHEDCGSWYLGLADAVLVKRWPRPMPPEAGE